MTATALERDLLEVAQIGRDHVALRLAGIMETACQLDEDHEPIVSTLPDEDKPEIERLQQQLDFIMKVIARAKARSA